MEANKNNSNLWLAIFFIAASVCILAAIMLWTLDKITASQVIEDTSGDATFYFEIQPAYLLYPGQEVTFSSNVAGVNILYFNDQIKVDNYEEVQRVDHCTPLVWAGETQSGVAFQYSLQPSYLLQQSLLWLGLGISFALFLLAGTVHPLPVLSRLALETRTFLGWHTNKQPASLTMPIMLIGITALMILLNIDDSCTVSTAFFASPRNVFYVGLIFGSFILFIASLIRSAWSRPWFVVHGYVAMMLLVYLAISWRANTFEANYIQGWGSVVLIAAITILALTSRDSSSATSKRLLLIVVIVAIIANMNLLYTEKRHILNSKTELLRNLSPYPAQMDVYQFIHDHYRNREMWVNLPPELNEPEQFDFSKLFSWGGMNSVHQVDQPELYLTPGEVEMLLAEATEEMWLLELGFFMIPANEATRTPLLMTQFDNNKMLLIPFEYLPERIKTAWPPS